MKRKRKTSNADLGVSKRVKAIIGHPVLCHYYSRVETLREHVLIRLPPSKKRILLQPSDLDNLLDSTWIGSRLDSGQEDLPTESSQYEGNHDAGQIVDFAIWTLFNKIYPNSHRPPHILCHGIQRASATWQNGQGISVACRIPGLMSTFPNSHVETLKSPAWCKLIALLGKSGSRIMFELILENAIFIPVSNHSGNLYQLSGVPIHDLNPKTETLDPKQPRRITNPEAAKSCRSASDIRFVRHRMFYAKSALNAKGEAAMGLGHIHAMNRCTPNSMLQYMFPRQFRLHNVFTSRTDPRDTMQPFKDYTLREDVTSRLIPKRLRGELFELVRKLLQRHKRCSYSMLLEHYCSKALSSSILIEEHDPESVSKANDLISRRSTPAEHVSAFCRATFAKVFPAALFGEGNIKVVLKNIDTFIKARRFESLTLQKVTDGLKIHGILWLQLPEARTCKMSMSDFKKRWELLNELIYYIFDSFIVPLIRSNFHVTESSMNKNQLLYFRHDVWRRISEPSLALLKKKMFVEMEFEHATKILATRTMGYGQVRLLPKSNDMRPIANLRRRCQDGKGVLGRSINSILAPVSSILNYEKRNQPHRLGSSLFSVGEIYTKIQTFRAQFEKKKPRAEFQMQTLRAQSNSPFYFVKVDVQSCFDSLPQAKLFQLVQTLLSSEEYAVASHAEIRSRGNDPIKKFCRTGTILGEFDTFVSHVQQLDLKCGNAVFADNVVPKPVPKQAVLKLLEDHIHYNIVKFGKKFHRQKQGIPQGSVLSSLLCSLLYAEFEKQNLSFLSPAKSLLLRLIDDFLLITSSRDEATRFLNIMADGCPEYGITIRPTKSLTNLPVSSIPQVAHSLFPYCGVGINTTTLDINKILTIPARPTNSLTVEYSKTPGQIFRRKMLNAVRVQMLSMLFDTAHNSRATVIRNLHLVYMETAQKCLWYIRCLHSRNKKPGAQMMIDLVKAIVNLSLTLFSSRRNARRYPYYECSIRKPTAQWLACNSFLQVFQNQTRYTELCMWLENVKETASPVNLEILR